MLKSDNHIITIELWCLLAAPLSLVLSITAVCGQVYLLISNLYHVKEGEREGRESVMEMGREKVGRCM